MATNFDDLSKGLAGRATRRGALRLFGAAVVGAVAATFRPGGANAGNLATHCNKVCKKYSGQERADCVRRCVCGGLGGEVCGPSKIRCPSGTKCGLAQINGRVIDDLQVNGTINGYRLTCIPLYPDNDKEG